MSDPAAPALPLLPREPAQDFEALLAQGLAAARAWSGAVWTDFGEHDPGVTILELLCYGLIDIGYRAGFPIQDLLASGSSGALGQLLAPPHAVLPGRPVTPDDFRKLLIDRIPGLADAWVEAFAPGLYQLRLYRPPHLPGLLAPRDPEAEQRIADQAVRLFHRNRPLGEDLEDATVLRPVRVAIHARVSIEPRAQAEQVAAEILFRLGTLVAPEPRRRSIDEMDGASLADLLEGPRLARGFLLDADLRPRKGSIDSADAARQVSAVPGVLSVDDLAVYGPAHPIGEDECLALDAGLGGAHPFLTLSVRGSVLDLDWREVRHLLAARWAHHRRSFRTRAEIAAKFPQARGRVRRLDTVEPLATGLPALYGVGPRGLGRDAAPARRRAAAQLAGYLALFDALLQDPASRLAQLCWLLAGAPETLTPPDCTIAPDAVQRRALAEFALALAGETSQTLIPHLHGPSGAAHADRVLHGLARAFAGTNARRGLGADYHRGGRRHRHAVSGLEQRARLLLGEGPVQLAIVEHVLLRQRVRASTCQPAAGTMLKIGVAIHAPGRLPESADWRRQVEAMLRAETPAHLALVVHFLDAAEWARFARLHRLWEEALHARYYEAADIVSGMLACFFDSIGVRQ